MAMAIPVMKFQVWGCKISIWNYGKPSKKSIVNSNTVPSLYCTWHFMCVEMRNQRPLAANLAGIMTGNGVNVRDTNKQSIGWLSI